MILNSARVQFLLHYSQAALLDLITEVKKWIIQLQSCLNLNVCKGNSCSIISAKLNQCPIIDSYKFSHPYVIVHTFQVYGKLRNNRLQTHQEEWCRLLQTKLCIELCQGTSSQSSMCSDKDEVDVDMSPRQQATTGVVRRRPSLERLRKNTEQGSMFQKFCQQLWFYIEKLYFWFLQ